MVAVVVAQAERYPPGLNPDLCPNHLYCSSIHYSPHVPYAVAANHNYPAGVSPVSCPNYPYCSHYVSHVAAASLPRYSAARVPCQCHVLSSVYLVKCFDISVVPRTVCWALTSCCTSWFLLSLGTVHIPCIFRVN